MLILSNLRKIQFVLYEKLLLSLMTEHLCEKTLKAEKPQVEINE